MASAGKNMEKRKYLHNVVGDISFVAIMERSLKKLKIVLQCDPLIPLLSLYIPNVHNAYKYIEAYNYAE
jgi:hypothetical protein